MIHKNYQSLSRRLVVQYLVLLEPVPITNTTMGSASTSFSELRSVTNDYTNYYKKNFSPSRTKHPVTRKTIKRPQHSSVLDLETTTETNSEQTRQKDARKRRHSIVERPYYKEYSRLRFDVIRSPPGGAINTAFSLQTNPTCTGKYNYYGRMGNYPRHDELTVNPKNFIRREKNWLRRVKKRNKKKKPLPPLPPGTPSVLGIPGFTTKTHTTSAFLTTKFVDAIMSAPYHNTTMVISVIVLQHLRKARRPIVVEDVTPKANANAWYSIPNAFITLALKIKIYNELIFRSVYDRKSPRLKFNIVK
ncbi:hypothetical protein RhiirA4_481861 [Rhizophagus irregularis]|uniref:Uncharacterized protein n=1 Tax=Rhizophagus irregularis TaxID=588596 RepID=A0A2I1HJT0_9GLOM|nr:hypothetical protein RhiirA4_470124 [Rhizophagus irregularis]PKY58743.1 hypothetical protein RhiirA4_480907 [Rhizophagus irregularis]PKY59119.1 hypothetical protein RhiirA4_481605 [Rhizophagus irregularis]PKY59266.1 hypothetical protein RhiirA4_481861 [Rhizophagus irregularis]